MSDLYKIVNGKRIKLTAKQKTAREAEELANQPTKADKKRDLRDIRDKALNVSTVTYDGSDFQTRPSDLINFTTMLTLLQNDTDEIIWTLADDSEKTITKDDLQAVYLLGLQAGALIDKDYRDAVRVL
jgi:hypothetical protein